MREEEEWVWLGFVDSFGYPCDLFVYVVIWTVESRDRCLDSVIPEEFE